MTRIVLLRPLPARPADGHKGTFGRVLVLGGNAETIGAPAFSALAAYDAGAGYVQVGTPRESLLATLGLVPQAVGLALPDGDVDAAFEKADVIAIGPGLGHLDASRPLVDRTLTSGKPVVLDADALNLIAAAGAWPVGVTARCVLTPHPGEMKRLGPLFGKPDQPADPEAERIDTAVRAARAFGQVVVLKFHQTIVTDGTRVYVNRTGSSALAKAGSGDVLSGVTAAMLARRGVDPCDAACTAVWVQGKAGEIAGQRTGERSATSPDLIAAIGAALKMYVTAFGEETA